VGNLVEPERPRVLAAQCAADTVRHSATEQGRHGRARSSPRVVELTEVITVAGYGALPDVYEWLIPDAMLTPAGAVAAFSDLVKSLPPNARVLDCACGTGQLAVGLAGLGLDVVAADASGGMIRRTQELADEMGVSLRTLHASWDELPDHLDASTFDLVFCVGNSLGHAEGASGRLAALAAMARLLSPGGRLVLTSRTWELVRSSGSRLDTRDRLIRRNGRDAVVTYYWQIEQRWEQEHNLEIAVAQVEPDGSVRACTERLSIWPFRYEELVAQLQSVGLKVETSTFDPDADGYMVVAGSEHVPVMSEPSS
jgi:SAM-dependent methyltransferase